MIAQHLSYAKALLGSACAILGYRKDLFLFLLNHSEECLKILSSGNVKCKYYPGRKYSPDPEANFCIVISAFAFQESYFFQDSAFLSVSNSELIVSP